MAGLVAWRDALAGWGARIGSPASASLSLLRASLDGPLYLGGGRPKLSRVLGGRQESFVPPGVYGAFVNVDLSAAYARALGQLIYPGTWWREWDGELPRRSRLPIMARAVVRVPSLAAGPLPIRPRTRPETALMRYTERIDYPTSRRVQGLWTLAELQQAEAAGCAVRVLRAWMMLGPPRRPFERWWRRIEKGRKLPGFGGDLFKLTGNTLWGRFALDGVRTEDRWRDGHHTAHKILGDYLNPAYGAEDVSELIASGVRARLYGELIRPNDGSLISVHTDGGLIRGPGPDRCPPGWRVKRSGSLLIYLGPQMYAYREHGARELTFVVSGIAPDSAPAAFGGAARQSIGWPPTSFGDSLAARERRALARIVAALG
jgi:hypothetical protein